MNTYNYPISNILHYANMATPTDSPYYKDKRIEIKRMATCSICKYKELCTVTENNGIIIYYCDTCYARELTRSVSPMNFSRPKRTRIYVKQSIR